MPKVSVLVEIPEGYELACDEMRPPKAGEYFFDGEEVRQWDDELTNLYRFNKVIVRPARAGSNP